MWLMLLLIFILKIWHSMFSRCTFALLFYKCLQLCRYLCSGHNLDPVSSVICCLVCWMQYFCVTDLINTMRVFDSRIQDNEKNYEVRKQEQSIEVFTFPIIFHMQWVDSKHISWTPYGHFFIMYPLWSPYEMHHSLDIPCGFHGISNEFYIAHPCTIP